MYYWIDKGYDSSGGTESGERKGASLRDTAGAVITQSELNTLTSEVKDKDRRLDFYYVINQLVLWSYILVVSILL